MVGVLDSGSSNPSSSLGYWLLHAKENGISSRLMGYLALMQTLPFYLLVVSSLNFDLNLPSTTSLLMNFFLMLF